MAATEERLAADIELDSEEAAIADLQALLAAHPLRENLSGLLMLALYRSGRQGDALAVFAATRHTLAEQLGVDPGPALKDMQLRILKMDDSLTGTGEGTPPSPEAPPLVRPAQLPPDRTAFAGRRAELAELSSLLEEDSRVRAVVVSGMAGTGKTPRPPAWRDWASARRGRCSTR